MWTSPYSPVEVGGTTLPGLVDAAIAAHPDRTALVDGPSGASVTYAELGRRVARISAWLAGPGGVRAGDTIALWSPNTPPWAACALAAQRLGAAVTALNPQWTEREAATQLADAGAALVITTPELVEMARGLPGVRQVVVLGSAPGGVPLSALLSHLTPVPPAVTDPAAVALVPYSSGTTGLPKGVLLTHANLVTAVRQIRVVTRVGPADTVLALAPFFHVLGSVVTLAMPLAAGATVVTVPRLEPATLPGLIDQHRVTFTAVPPPVAAVLANGPALSTMELVAVGGAALPLALHEALAARLPRCVVGQGWGLTETTAGICVPDRLDPTPPGTVGRLLPNTDLLVVAPDTGRPVGVDEPGELWVRGPQLMAGYRHQAASPVDRDGWLHTGDLGRIDAAGAVTVVDRLKELIKVDGFQVAPAELEALLIEHPDVADAGVVGCPDERHGEVPVAFVVPGRRIDEAALAAWLAERVAPYKRPRRIVTVDRLPRTPAGKLLRRELR
jgi:acyl-CoA synthetase (AMP-forming)/AMP-acid ligase II